MLEVFLLHPVHANTIILVLPAFELSISGPIQSLDDGKDTKRRLLILYLVPLIIRLKLTFYLKALKSNVPSIMHT